MDNKKLLIFDYDGTLVDTSTIHQRAFAEVLKPLSIACDYDSIAGMRTQEAIIQLLKQSDIEYSSSFINDLVKKKQELAQQLMHQELKLFPNVEQFLHQASEFHHMVIVSSSSKKSIELGLRRLNLSDLFSDVICAEDVTNCKPDPEGFLLALLKTGINAQSAMVFEDSMAGFWASKAAGIDYIDVRTFDWIYKL